jgi:hypothetical protein
MPIPTSTLTPTSTPTTPLPPTLRTPAPAPIPVLVLTLSPLTRTKLPARIPPMASTLTAVSSHILWTRALRPGTFIQTDRLLLTSTALRTLALVFPRPLSQAKLPGLNLLKEVAMLALLAQMISHQIPWGDGLPGARMPRVLGPRALLSRVVHLLPRRVKPLRTRTSHSLRLQLSRAEAMAPLSPTLSVTFAISTTQ